MSRSSFFYFPLVVFVLLYIPASTGALTISPNASLLYSGCHPITPEKQQALRSAGAEIPSSGQFCDKDKPLLYGSCASSPIPYLMTKRANAGVDVSGFNADFACRLSKFLQAADADGMNIKITSGYRSVAKQAALYAKRTPGVPVAPPGRSRHNFGIAADLTFDGVWPSFGLRAGNTPACLQRLRSCKWAHDNNTRFGLKYPMQVEPWHIEPGTAVKGGDLLPSDPNYWSSDAGTSYSGSPLAPAQPYAQPTMVNSLPNNMGTPSRSNTSPSSQNQTQSQPQICTPEFSCRANIMYYKTTSCTEQIYQTCPYGCNGNTCNLSTSTAQTSTSLGSAFATSSNTNDNTNTNDATTTGGSISDFLNSYINPTAVEIGTSSSVAFRLNPETGDIEQIPQTTGSGLSSSTNVITSVQPIAGQQTFTSGDLSGSYSSFSGSQQSSVLQRVLDGMKSALLWAVNALRSL